MNEERLSVVSIALLSLMSICASQTTLKASINMTGVTGEVSFYQLQPGSTINVNFELSGLSGIVQVDLRQSWVDYTVQHKCADDVIGTSYNSNTAWSISTGNEVKSISSSVANDIKQLMGRSVLITMGNDRACGTVMLESRTYFTAMARLQNGGINGDVWFRQAQGERTEILTDMFDPFKTTTMSYKWKLFNGASMDCKTMSSLFNPTSKDNGLCSVTNKDGCPIGDLDGKLGNIEVGRTQGSTKTFYHDTDLPLEGSNSIVGTHLAVLDGLNSIISCGHVVQVNNKIAKAEINKDDVIGRVKFDQRSPFDVTNIYITLVKLGKKAGGLHIHEFPVPSQIEADDQLCSPDSVGGHWNPYKQNFPGSGSTADMYEVGDISGRYNVLENLDQYYTTVSDINVPMFGPNSIIGRSLVIHKSPSGDRWICANIEVIGAMATASATFTSKVIGNVIFSQSMDDPTSDTWVYGELNYGDGVSSSSSGHMWMIQENQVSNKASNDYCSNPGPMFNPFRAKKDGDYSSQCKASNPLRCQVGDGTRMAGPLAIRYNTKPKKFFYTVRNMPLTGPGRIMGKSLFIYAANKGMSVLDCANIYHLRMREAIVDSWSNDVEGYFKFSQQYSIISSPTIVSINVTDMNNIAGNYHVHLFPVPPNSDNPCSGNSVAGHYNPFNVVAASSPSPKNGTFDKYESGDLSGKNGQFADMNSYDGVYADNMLSLFGVRSVVGRSVVIHKMADGSRWSCGTVREDEIMTGGTMHRAIAEFDTPDVKGHVVMTQYIYLDGSMSDTTVYVYINHTDSTTETSGHKISIGRLPAWGDRSSSTERCASTGETYNPFMVNTQTGYSECGIHTPLRCAAGDVSSKLGTYSVSGGKMLNTDVNLPLSGKHSVIGRSLVLGVANGGAGKLACSNIKPVQYEKSFVYINKPSAKSLMDVADAYAKALKINNWDVAVFGDDKKGDCGSFDVYFMGPYAKENKRRFITMVIKSDNALGSYQPSTCSADSVVSSLLLLGIMFFIEKVLV